MERITTTDIAEALSSEEAIFDAPVLEVSNVKATPAVPTMMRSPRPKQTMAGS